MYLSIVKVLSQDNEVIQFGVITDIQYCDCDPSGDRLYRGVPEKLRDAIDILEAENIEYILNFGDVINKHWSSFDTILPILNNASFNVYYTLGNHDFYELSQEQKDSLTTVLNMPSRYYTFKKGRWRFVLLDANELSTYAYSDGSNEKLVAANYINNLDPPNNHFWNGGLFSNQLQWLRNLLSKADTLGEFVIVGAHPNIYPLNMNSMLNYTEVAQILESHNSVKLYMAGHWHNGAYVVNNNLPYLTFKAMLDYPDSTAFSILTINDEEIIVDGYGREIDRNIPYQSTYELTVQDGTAGGTHQQGSTIEIAAVPPESYMKFSYWSGDVDILNSVTDSTLSFPMPAFDVNLVANFITVGFKQNPYLRLKVYPNPVNDQLIIENENRITEVGIYDVLGKHHAEMFPGSSRFSLDFNWYSNGIYIIKLKDEDGNTCRKKVIKYTGDYQMLMNIK